MNNRQKVNLALIAFMIYLIWSKMSSGYTKCENVKTCPSDMKLEGNWCLNTTVFPFKTAFPRLELNCSEQADLTKVADKADNVAGIAGQIVAKGASISTVPATGKIVGKEVGISTVPSVMGPAGQIADKVGGTPQCKLVYV